MSALAIRDARRADRDRIEAVTLAAYEQYAAVLRPPYWDAYRENIVRTLAAAPLSVPIVAEEDGALVASVLLYPAGTVMTPPGGASTELGTPEVRLLAVAPSARGRGVGETLMRECIDRTRRAGAAALTLHTTDMMDAAIRLYTRVGFQRAPELDFQPVPDLLVKGF
ncbi:MAG TPA: GNAT family N-acetyltransferase, partial [Candidatus Limnocylindrales bacterium]|nr:GNAT family N-acetyltransferase [Candidatus Limnocylindrales bacterium]